MKYSESLKLRKAKRKVEAIKNFYKHLLVYIIVNLFLFIVRAQVFDFYLSDSPDKEFIDWIDWNIFIGPFFWGIGLLFHASKVFDYKLKFLKNWEERQIKKYLEEH